MLTKPSARPLDGDLMNHVDLAGDFTDFTGGWLYWFRGRHPYHLMGLLEIPGLPTTMISWWDCRSMAAEDPRACSSTRSAQACRAGHGAGLVELTPLQSEYGTHKTVKG